MDAREITIKVDAEAAEEYVAASAEERKKIDLLLSLCLSQAVRSPGPLEQVMREISRAAQSRGLTEKEMNELLRGE